MSRTKLAFSIRLFRGEGSAAILLPTCNSPNDAAMACFALASLLTRQLGCRPPWAPFDKADEFCLTSSPSPQEMLNAAEAPLSGSSCDGAVIGRAEKSIDPKA